MDPSRDVACVLFWDGVSRSQKKHVNFGMYVIWVSHYSQSSLVFTQWMCIVMLYCGLIYFCSGLLRPANFAKYYC